MQSRINLHATTSGGDIQDGEVLIEENKNDNPLENPRLAFARRFLQHILADHYPLLHVGDTYREDTLRFSFVIQHVHITLSTVVPGEKRVIVTGILSD